MSSTVYREKMEDNDNWCEDLNARHLFLPSNHCTRILTKFLKAVHAICGVIASSRVAGGASATSAILVLDTLVVSTNCVPIVAEKSGK